MGQIGRVALASIHHHVSDSLREAAVQSRELSAVLCDDQRDGMGEEKGAREGGGICI